VEGSYNFAGTTNQAQVPTMLYSLAASGTMYANGSQLINKTGLIAVPAAGTIPPANTTAGTLAAGNYPNGYVASTASTYGASFMSPGASASLQANLTAAGTAGLNLGSGWSSTYSTSTNTFSYTAAAATVLVTSPITSACSACHDSAEAVAHFQSNGGQFYAARGSATLTSNEQCLICHGAGKVADAQTVHMNFN
jgi:hypothetical protein